MNIDVLKAATSGLESGKKTALATVTQVNGSAPGITGAMMVVFENGTQAGTIGGGKLEHAVISSIHKAFETGESFEFDYDLSKDGELEMVCGGRIKGFVNMLLPNRRLIIFGAGHVSQQIAAAASGLPFDITVVDDRAQFQSCFQAPHAYLACTPSQS
ncbi:MAG: XdhC family protein, partial [Defluviitaleaceae bacterium]|nr:XdhC family protein [Defluviitaleaceae bacterium]